MRLLVVLPDLRRGGAETLAVETACALSTSGLAHVEVALLQGVNVYADRLADAGVSVHSLGLRHRYDIVAARRLATLVRDRGTQLIHAHLLPAIIPSVYAAQRIGLPLVVTEHSVWNRRRRLRSIRHVERWLYARVDRLLCVSDSVREALATWLPDVAARSLVLHNGVPVRPLGAHVAPKYDLVFVGNMDRPAKGADVLLHALADCRDAFGLACVVGDGRLRPELERLRDSLGLRSQVEFVGSSDRVASLLESSRIFVLPSRWEGLPMALLEAMERGLPVVATCVGGIPEAIKDRATGMLVPPDDAAGLSEALRELLGSEELCRLLGNAARREVETRFSLASSLGVLRAIYDDLSDSARGTILGEGQRLWMR